MKWYVLFLVCCAPLFAQEGFVNAPAPDFTLPNLNSNTGQAYSLAKTFTPDSGRAVIVCFFASWCVQCRQELIFMKYLIDSLYPKKLRLAAVCVEDSFSGQQRKFVQLIGLTCPVVFDSSTAVRKAYHLPERLPYAVIVDRKGIVFTTCSGYSGRAREFIEDSVKKMFAREKRQVTGPQTGG